MRVETVKLQSDSWIFNYGESERTNSGWGIMSERLRNWEKDADWDFVSQTAAYTFPSQKWRTIIGLTAALRILHHQCSRVAQQELLRDLVIRTKAEQAIKSTALVSHNCQPCWYISDIHVPFENIIPTTYGLLTQATSKICFWKHGWQGGVQFTVRIQREWHVFEAINFELDEIDWFF